MGFLDSLFGGGAPSSKDVRTGEQKDLATQIYQLLSQRLGGESAPYGGNLTTSYGKGWENYIGGLLGTPVFDRDSQSRAISTMLSGAPSYRPNYNLANGYFQNSVATPAMQLFDEQIAPRLREGFASPGGNFTSREGTAMTRALGQLDTSLNAELSKLAYENQALEAQLAESAAQRQAVGLQAAQNFSMQPIAQAGAIRDVLTPAVQVRQQNNANLYNDFLRQQNQGNQNLAQALQFTMAPWTTQYQKSGIIPQIMGGVGAIGGTMMGLSNINTIGQQWAGGRLTNPAPVNAMDRSTQAVSNFFGF